MQIAFELISITHCRHISRAALFINMCAGALFMYEKTCDNRFQLYMLQDLLDNRRLLITG